MTMEEETESAQVPDKVADNVKDANMCMLIGAGIGVLGIAGALAAGAVCPVCVIAAPGLIGAGLVKRLAFGAGKSRRSS